MPIRAGKLEKLYEHILMRRSDANVPFETLCALLRRIGFDERIKGDHPDTLFVAETLGCSPEQTKQTASAGFDVGG